MRNRHYPKGVERFELSRCRASASPLPRGRFCCGKGAEPGGNVTGSIAEKAASSALEKLSSMYRGIERDTAIGDLWGQRAQEILLPKKWHLRHLAENFLISLNLIFIIPLRSRQLTWMLSKPTPWSFLCLLPRNGGDAGAGEGRKGRLAVGAGREWPGFLLHSQRAPLLCVCHFRPRRAPSSLLMLLCIFQLNFLHEKERGTLKPLALVIMQMLQGVDCPSLHIIKVSGYEWRVCYFPPPPTRLLCWNGVG